jgi:ankyrin repeat protein
LFYNSQDYINAEFGNSDYKGTLMHFVAVDCNKDTILTLLRRGADVTLEDSLQQLPLEVAIDNNNSKSLADL